MSSQSASQRHSLIDTITDAFVPIHPDGHKFVGFGLLATIILFLLMPTLGWISAIITAWIAYFFRDPVRVAPLREGLILAAADGRVSVVEEVRPPVELGLGEDRRVRVSVFLSIFDVHIQRAPIAGHIKHSIYVPGRFINAASDKASEDNERRSLVIEPAQGVAIAVVQIAGLVARRIVTFAEEGQSIGAAERFGLIRFGSRVDVYLPPGQTALVSVGQRTIAGETVLADLRSDEAEREARAI
ncbi:MAG: phosphatidylserine decarboxylase [Pseudomonadota bacterium]